MNEEDRSLVRVLKIIILAVLLVMAAAIILTWPSQEPHYKFTREACVNETFWIEAGYYNLDCYLEFYCDTPTISKNYRYECEYGRCDVYEKSISQTCTQEEAEEIEILKKKINNTVWDNCVVEFESEEEINAEIGGTNYMFSFKPILKNSKFTKPVLIISFEKLTSMSAMNIKGKIIYPKNCVNISLVYEERETISKSGLTLEILEENCECLDLQGNPTTAYNSCKTYSTWNNALDEEGSCCAERKYKCMKGYFMEVLR